MPRGRKTVLTKPMRAKVLGKILQGQSDDQIAKSLGLNVATIKGYYHRWLLPKRKDVLTFLIKEHLEQFYVLNNTEYYISDMARILNESGVYNQCGKLWSYVNLKTFLQRNGYENAICGHQIDTRHLLGNEKTFYETFEVCELRLQFDRYVKQMRLPPVKPKPQKVISQWLKETGVGIRKAISNGARTNADITNYLNSNGYLNKVGKEFGRWSVVGIMERLCIQVPVKKKEWGNAEKQYLIGKISSFSKKRQIPREMLKKWADELDTDSLRIKDKNGLVQSVIHLRARHNKIVRNQKYYKEWFSKIDYAVNVTFRHKSIGRSELAEHFGVCAMSIQRHITNIGYDVQNQYYLRFKVLYASYLEQTKGSEWSAEKCAKWFNRTYLKTERGADWTYINIKKAINKLYRLEDEGLYG